MLQPKVIGFLAVPCKGTSATDWTSQVKACLAGLEEDVSSFEGEMGGLNRLRSDVMGAEANGAGLSIVYRYYCQLESMINRFPGLQKPQLVVFEWCRILMF